MLGQERKELVAPISKKAIAAAKLGEQDVGAGSNVVVSKVKTQKNGLRAEEIRPKLLGGPHRTSTFEACSFARAMRLR